MKRRSLSLGSLLLALGLAVVPRVASSQSPAASAPGPASSASSRPVASAASSSSAPAPSTTTVATRPPVDAHAAGFTLKECLELADRNHPSILAASARVENYRAQLSEAHSAPFTAFTLTGGAGPAPQFRGGPVYTQDREVGLSSNIGMAWQMGVSGTIPIWTFGKITNTWRAAEAQIAVGEEDVKIARNGIRTEVRRAFYGLQLSRESIALLHEAEDKLDGALGNLEKKVKDGDGDDIDLLRLQTARAELDGRMAEAEKGQRVALAALRFYTGVEAGFEIMPGPLKPPKHDLGELSTYLDAARGYRPEMAKARAALRAREALVDLARSKMMPDIGLSLFWSYSRAPEITDQFNPFVRDDANYLRYGFALGMRWQLDFIPGVARIRQADAALEDTRQQARMASEGIPVEVEKAWAEAQEAKKKSDAYQRASKNARRWMIKVSQGIDVGTMEEKDMVDPTRQYALQRFNYLSALLDLNMAMSNLAEKTGWDIVAEPLE